MQQQWQLRRLQLRQWLQLHGDGGGGDSCKCAVTATAAATMAAVMAATAR